MNKSEDNSTLPGRIQRIISVMKAIPRQVGVHYSCTNHDKLATEFPATRSFIDRLAETISNYNPEYFNGIYELPSICMFPSSDQKYFYASGYEGTIDLGLKFIAEESFEAQVSALSHEFVHVLGHHQSITTHYPKMLDDDNYAKEAIEGIEVSKKNAQLLVDFYNMKVIESPAAEQYALALDFSKAKLHKAKYLLREEATIYKPQHDLTRVKFFPDIEEVADKLTEEQWLPGSLGDEDTSPELQSWQEDEANRTGLHLVEKLGLSPLEYASQITLDLFSTDPDFSSFEECIDKIRNGVVPVWHSNQGYPTPCRMVYNILMEAQARDGMPSANAKVAVVQEVQELRALHASAKNEIIARMPEAVGK